MDWDTILIGIEIILGLTIVIGAITLGVYYTNKLSYENFQATIKDLSPEQKCIHICAFDFGSQSLIENYKFCLEKCDRISERTISGGN